MGRINIIGGSPLRIDFEIDNPAFPGGVEKAPKDFEVELERQGNTYRVVRKVGGGPLETATGPAAKLRVHSQGNQRVEVDYDQ